MRWTLARICSATLNLHLQHIMSPQACQVAYQRQHMLESSSHLHQHATNTRLIRSLGREPASLPSVTTRASQVLCSSLVFLSPLQSARSSRFLWSKHSNTNFTTSTRPQCSHNSLLYLPGWVVSAPCPLLPPVPGPLLPTSVLANPPQSARATQSSCNKHNSTTF